MQICHYFIVYRDDRWLQLLVPNLSAYPRAESQFNYPGSCYVLMPNFTSNPEHIQRYVSKTTHLNEAQSNSSIYISGRAFWEC
jgi:hypothetical protein